jgi:hypothetical protein
MKVYQIFYHINQIPKLDFTPVYNHECTVFFENSIIRKLVENDLHLSSDYFGVVSHSLRDKVRITKTSWKNSKNIANVSINEFTPEHFREELYKNKPDAMSFQRHMPHDPIRVADKYHPNFSKYFKEIMQKAGYNWEPIHLEDVFYCNYFVAKSEIYEKYVQEMLIPCMDIMKEMPELMENSRYPKALPDHLKKSFGINHYPYHPFLCERMFSYFAHLHKLKCLHY